MLPAIHELTLQLDAAPAGACEALARELLAQVDSPEAAGVFTELLPDLALAAARAADARRAAGAPRLPLDGLPVTIKDLFDLQGRPTRAGALKVRDDAPPAAADAPAVARLLAAGALPMGRTQMSEFAFSGVGLNPHGPQALNPHDTAVRRIPGGSTSGGAVSVALGLAVAALGSDTGGSIRIPAALCGLVGFKNTQRRTPLEGAFPLSPTLDTVSAMTRCVADALRVDAVLSGEPLLPPRRDARGLRLLLPRTLWLDAMDDTVAGALQRTLQRLSAAGAEIVERDVPELNEPALINAAPAGLAPIEAWAIHRDALATRRDRFDPRVAARIEQGREVSAADYLRLLQRRRDWIARLQRLLQGFDALIGPTVPIVAPPIAELQRSDEAFWRANGLLLRNPATINFLDGCAFSLPMHAPGEGPSGLMLAAPGGHDAALAGVALAVEAVLNAPA